MSNIGHNKPPLDPKEPILHNINSYLKNQY